MTPEHLQEIEHLYQTARDLSASQRRALLQTADPALRAEVEALLAAKDAGRNPSASEDDTRGLETVTRIASGLQLGPYKLETLLGEGGMGAVYRGLDTRLGRPVAIKVLAKEFETDPAFKRRFLNEARAASALNHPNIAVFYDISSDSGVEFLVMEYVGGQTLKDLIPPGGMSFDQVAELGSQVALALGAAHAAGIVHRDVKPANILVTPEQQVKVVDFGIARLQRDANETQLTVLGEVVGTVAYMSPEQTRGEDVDASSDIFSLGCVLYQAATGRLPFSGPNTLATIHNIATSTPAPPSAARPDLPPEFDRLVARCLAKMPSERPESAVELATELKSLTFPASVPPKVGMKRPSLAVIPPLLRGPETEQYLCVSLADAIIHRLSSSGKLLVRPIASVMRYVGKETDWVKVAREQGVDLVVEGVIQTMGPKVRVLIQAHRTSDSQTLASIKQDGDTGDLFGLQDRVTDAVTAVFLPRDTTSSQTAVPTTRHPVAFDLYLRAVERQLHMDPFDMSSAIEMLTRATDLDPGFADAWGLLAQAYAQMGAHLDHNPKWFDLGEQAIARTLELDPVQCDALCARSMIVWSPSRKFQNRAALRALNAALKIDPNRQTARHQRAAVLWHLGFLDAATRDAEETTVGVPYVHLALVALQRGEFQKSVDYHQRAVHADPNNFLAYPHFPLSLLWGGYTAEARDALEQARLRFPNESFVTGMDAILAALDGDFARAESLGDEAGSSPRSLTHTHHTWHFCAGAYALIGNTDKALA
jgi:serine/threonine protein kinase/tetratricopeptide (TPR) repeat protein